MVVDQPRVLGHFLFAWRESVAGKRKQSIRGDSAERTALPSTLLCAPELPSSHALTPNTDMRDALGIATSDNGVSDRLIALVRTLARKSAKEWYIESQGAETPTNAE
jgi:hypothetical protein